MQALNELCVFGGKQGERCERAAAFIVQEQDALHAAPALAARVLPS